MNKKIEAVKKNDGMRYLYRVGWINESNGKEGIIPILANNADAAKACINDIYEETVVRATTVEKVQE